ncbi:hypothetical protein ACIXMO_11005 [Bacteroides fragilis]
MKVMKYFAVASLALFAACNNEENPVAPESGNQPVDVVMSVALPGPGTRAAMGELQNTAKTRMRHRLKNCMCTWWLGKTLSCRRNLQKILMILPS